MKIISLVNSKGGVGKTTLCINLARYVQLYFSTKIQNDKSKKVLLIDADPQGSLRIWHDVGGSSYLDLIIADKKSSIAQLPCILKKTEYDFVFIDTPPTLNEMIGSTIAISDTVLIPIQPGSFDIWASKNVTELISTRHAVLGVEKPNVFYILNASKKKTKIEKEVFDYLNKSTFKPMYQCTHHYVDYPEMSSEGKTIFECKNELPISEMKMLGAQLLVYLEEVIL